MGRFQNGLRAWIAEHCRWNSRREERWKTSAHRKAEQVIQRNVKRKLNDIFGT